MKMINGFPRRNKVELMTDEEKLIVSAKYAIEAAGCHQLLTEASLLLQQARDKVADWVELEETQPPKPVIKKHSIMTWFGLSCLLTYLLLH